MTTSARGRHRKLRRNIARTIVAISLLSGMFTAFDQGINALPANAAAPTIVSGTRSLDTTGTKFSLVFNTTLGTTTALPSSFTLAGTAVTASPPSAAGGTSIASVVANGTSLDFTLTNPIPAATTPLTLTVAYTAPTSNAATTNNAIQDTSGVDAATFAAQTITVTGSSVPAYVSSTINAAGSQITLTFNEALNATTAAPSNFEVLIGSLSAPTTASVATTVSSVSVSGSTVLLNLETPVESGKAVTVSYTAPVNDPLTTNNAIQDSSGIDSASFTSTYAKTVTNTNLTVPRLTTLAVAANGITLTLTYSEALNATTAPASAFTVLNDSDPIGVATAVVSASTTVVLTVFRAIGQNKPVTVSYVAPTVNTATTNAAVQDSAGNDAISFSTTTVTNSSTQDQTAPAISTATLDANGTNLTLGFTDANNLFATAGGTAPASALSVLVNGTSVTVSSATVTASSKNIVLALGSIVDSNDVVTVSYTAPAVVAGTGNAAIQDLAGNDSDSFTGQAVTNNSSIPALISINVSTADGKTVVLTYNETLNATTAPASAFSVVSAGRTTVPTTAVASGSTVTLTLPTGAEGSGTVVVNYTAPAVNTATTNAAVQDSAGNDAVSLPSATSPVVPTNSSTVDTLPPTFVSGYVSANGTNLVLTLSESVMSSYSRSDPWVVQVNGTNLSTQTNMSVISGNVITIPLNTLISSEKVVGISYVKQNNTTDVSDLAGNKVANFGPTLITNNSTVDRIAPVRSQAID
jgi:uncharacterized repeat protein (TIGR02059 family)